MNKFDGWRMYGIAVAVRLALLIILFRFFSESFLLFSDSKEYIGLAQSLTSGNGFAFQGIAYTSRTAGYPLILAAFHFLSSSLAAFSVFQIFIAATLPLLTFKIAEELGFSKRIATIAGFIVVFEPHMVFYSLPILPDVIFSVLFLLFVLFGIRYAKQRKVRDLAIASFIFGFGLHIKPALQAYPLMVLILFIALILVERSRKYIGHALVFIGIVAFLIAPWMIRNAGITGDAAMSSQGGAMVATKLAPSVMSVNERISFDEAEVILEERWDKNNPPMGDIAAYLILRPVALTNVLAMNSFLLWTSHNYAYIPSFLGILQAPQGYSDLPPSHLLLQGRIGEFMSAISKIMVHPYFMLALIGKLVWIVIALGFFLGLLKAIMKDKVMAASHLFIASLVITYTATTWINGFAVEGRLRLPFNAIMFIYAVGSFQPSLLRNLLIAIFIPIRWIIQLIRPIPEASVLFYHSISDEDDSFAVTPAEFEKQMKILKRVSHPISLEDVVAFARGEKKFSKPATAVSFDDGYKDFMDQALPILKKYDIPATVFITTKPDMKELGNDAPLLNEEEIRTLSREPLIEIGSHGVTHRKLSRLESAELQSELIESKTTLERITGKPCRFLAYPKGRTNESVQNASGQAGYEAGVTTVHGILRKGDDPFMLKRIIVKRDTGTFEFRYRLTRIVDWMQKIWHMYTDYVG